MRIAAAAAAVAPQAIARHQHTTVALEGGGCGWCYTRQPAELVLTIRPRPPAACRRSIGIASRVAL
eukprot:COSAG01_NODE_533_length_15816_cov_4.518738_20_plen_66_part_00